MLKMPRLILGDLSAFIARTVVTARRHNAMMEIAEPHLAPARIPASRPGTRNSGFCIRSASRALICRQFDREDIMVGGMNLKESAVLMYAPLSERRLSRCVSILRRLDNMQFKDRDYYPRGV